MRRFLLACGVVSPLLYALADTVAGIRWEGYSFRDQTISELGAIGAPTRGLFAAMLLATYLLLTAFGVGVWQSGNDNRRLQRAGALLVALGLLGLTIGQLVPMRARGSPQGMAGALHLAEGAVAMIVLCSAMWQAGFALSRRFRDYTLLTLAVVLAFGGWSASAAPAIEAGRPTDWVGVQERSFWYAYQVWFLALAVVLLRQTPRPFAAVAPNDHEGPETIRESRRAPG